MHISRGNETQDELLDAFSSIPRLDYVTKVRGSKTGILIAVEHWWTKRAWKEGAKKDKKWRKKKKNLIENYVYAPLPLPEDLPEEPEEPEVPDPAGVFYLFIALQEPPRKMAMAMAMRSLFKLLYMHN